MSGETTQTNRAASRTASSTQIPRRRGIERLSQGCKPTPVCLYRIAETGLSVASKSGKKRGDGVSGAVNGTWRAEAAADFGKAGAESFAGMGVVEQAEDLLRDRLRGEVLLNQLGNDRALGDEVDHAEVASADKRLGEEGGEGSDAIDDDHGDVEKGGFDGGGAAGNNGSVRGGERVVGLVFDDAEG